MRGLSAVQTLQSYENLIRMEGFNIQPRSEGILQRLHHAYD
jgi:hypothetical protein